jgi:sulfoxide reductase catalytic subunit YedY
MLIRQRKASDVPSHEITPESTYLNRRQLIEATGLIAGSLALGGTIGEFSRPAHAAVMPTAGGKFADVTKGYSKLGDKDAPTSFEDITTYNNFYEFGLDKGDPAEHAHNFKPLPWTVKVDGLCAKPGTIDFADLIKPHALEERVYRMRCVEAWSMVIPWVGIPLGEIVKRFEPQGSAKFVRFETVVRPQEMRGQRTANLPWPYIEGLRMDEAMNPLAIMAVGLYGQPLLGQSGAPLRLVVPWKYGFKGVKSIVRISFVEDQPQNTWKVMNPTEYGFYANVNPKVDHPRWSQASERRIGDFRRRPTLMFNGYEEEVAHLYKGMNLSRLY